MRLPRVALGKCPAAVHVAAGERTLASVRQRVSFQVVAVAEELAAAFVVAPVDLICLAGNVLAFGFCLFALSCSLQVYS